MLVEVGAIDNHAIEIWKGEDGRDLLRTLETLRAAVKVDDRRRRVLPENIRTEVGEVERIQFLFFKNFVLINCWKDKK